MLDIEERVDQGARLLDQKMPGWYERINTNTLQMHRADMCICGQLYGGFMKGRQALGIPKGQGEEYGLNASNALYPKLKELWIREIELRKPAATSPIESGLSPDSIAFAEQKELIGV